MRRARPGPVYAIQLQARAGDDGIHILRAALKVLLRRFGLRVIKIEETSRADNDRTKHDRTN
jgi:hypothetical protein